MKTEKEIMMMKEKPDYVQNIIGIIRSKDSPKVIGQKLEDYHANDLSDVLPLLELREREMLYRLLGSDMLSEILEYTEDANLYLDEMDIRLAVMIIEEMEPDEAVDILRAMHPQKRKIIVELVNESCRKSIQLLASYTEEQIASRMTTNFVTIRSSLSIKEAMDSVIEQAAEHDNITSIYVLDENDIYYGAISLKDLIIARSGMNIEDIIVTAYPYVYADEDVERCLEMLKDYQEDSIPVLSDENRILGVITAQDMIEVVDEELGEDYAKLAGLTAEEDLNEPAAASMRKRLPWLVLLLGMGLMVSSVVGLFEKVVSQLTLIICFQSLILDMSGNVGTQSLAVTIRVLMDEQLTGRKKLSLVFKEMRVGLANGMILGVLSFAGIGVYIMFAKGLSVQSAFAVSACIGISLLLAMLISSMVGTVVPLVFKQIGVDPAVASGPLITTINDLVAVVSYYGLAWVFLIQIMHMGS